MPGRFGGGGGALAIMVDGLETNASLAASVLAIGAAELDPRHPSDPFGVICS